MKKKSHLLRINRLKKEVAACFVQFLDVSWRVFLLGILVGQNSLLGMQSYQMQNDPKHWMSLARQSFRHIPQKDRIDPRKPTFWRIQEIKIFDFGQMLRTPGLAICNSTSGENRLMYFENIKQFLPEDLKIKKYDADHRNANDNSVHFPVMPREKYAFKQLQTQLRGHFKTLIEEGKQLDNLTFGDFKYLLEYTIPTGNSALECLEMFLEIEKEMYFKPCQEVSEEIISEFKKYLLKEKHLDDNAEYEKLRLEIEKILKNLNSHFKINNEAFLYISEAIIFEFKKYEKENAPFSSFPTVIRGIMETDTNKIYRSTIYDMLCNFITANPHF